MAPTEALVSLDPPKETVDRTTDFEGRELDYTSHEFGFAMRLLLKGNGNILERVLSPYQVVTSPEQAEPSELARKSVCTRFYSHYRGFFGTMRDQHSKAEPKTARGLL